MAGSSRELSRRALLLAGGGAAAFALTRRYRVAPAPTAAVVAPSPGPQVIAPAPPPSVFSDGERRTLEAAQELLLPSAVGSPGAREVHATGYLERELASGDILPSTRERVLRGAARLDRLAVASGVPAFFALAEERRREALRAFEDEDAGPEWFETMLDFTLEAFLGDPIHGGNPRGMVWSWLGHRPGFPRPGEGP
jgi:hypothetical protein